jgi:hypothetical protein
MKSFVFVVRSRHSENRCRSTDPVALHPVHLDNRSNRELLSLASSHAGFNNGEPRKQTPQHG